jgi:hypothetical protein
MDKPVARSGKRDGASERPLKDESKPAAGGRGGRNTAFTGSEQGKPSPLPHRRPLATRTNQLFLRTQLSVIRPQVPTTTDPSLLVTTVSARTVTLATLPTELADPVVAAVLEVEAPALAVTTDTTVLDTLVAT